MRQVKIKMDGLEEDGTKLVCSNGRETPKVRYGWRRLLKNKTHQIPFKIKY